MFKLFIISFILLSGLFSQETRHIKVVYHTNSNDIDGDCVINKYDKGPNTPKNVCVDKNGCIRAHRNPKTVCL